jgi:hypothetical protein
VGLSRLADDLQNQTRIPVHELPPTAGMTRQQFVKQPAICVCQRHRSLLLKTGTPQGNATD